MSLNMVGIGDLHLDSKLRKYLPNINHLIMDEVRKVMAYTERNGVNLVVFYGDICETPNISKEALNLLIEFIYEYPKHKLIFMTGNHDVENSEHHSLMVLKTLCKRGAFPNAKVVDSPKTMFVDTLRPLRLLPWPSFDTRKECLNVIHTEVDGAVWDHGRSVESKNLTKHHCVGGHLHTKQRVGTVHLSGTLYQTSFGEKPKKYFHHVMWGDEDKPDVQNIRHVPAFRLENAIIRSEADLAELSKDPSVLYKVFIHSDVALDASTLDAFPNIVKHNSFKSKVELRALINEEILLDEEIDQSSLITNEDAMKEWLLSTDTSDEMRKRVYKKFKSLGAVNR